MAPFLAMAELKRALFYSSGLTKTLGNMHGSLAWKIGQLIPDFRRQEFVHHSYMEMVSQRIGQILCGYEDANDCNQLRGDSALKMSVGRKPSDADLASQSTMTRLENNVGMKTLYKIGNGQFIGRQTITALWI